MAGKANLAAPSRDRFNNAHCARDDDSMSTGLGNIFASDAKKLCGAPCVGKIRSMARKFPHARRRIVWRVRVVMAERGVRSVSELVRRLDATGVSISVAQLGRLIDGKAQRWNQEVLEGMMAVLDCDLCDLVRSEPTSLPNAASKLSFSGDSKSRRGSLVPARSG